jgi:glycosyltransferase involved in cell wall biosynthesis
VKVSIVICTYNRREYLTNLLESIKQLSYPNFEVIVVDNNSTDDTAQIIKNYSVKYIKEIKQGLSYARNRGIEESSGEYVCFIDDDAIITNSHWVENMLRGFTLDVNIGATGGYVRPVYKGEQNIYTDLFLHFNGQDRGSQERIVDDNLLGGNIMYKREAIGHLRYNTLLGRKGNIMLGREEIEFNIKLKEKGYKLAYIPSASIDHMLLSKRFTFIAALNLNFYEGLSEYLENPGVLFRRLHKPITVFMALVLSLFTFNKKKIIARIIRGARYMGIFYGPIYRMRE